ncbi:ABC transporter related protein [Gemmatirosa kalamazoonensis]|uniref:ABC transporter related protein n=1 Tax=Gemmatirosa kalamazoonensis TaxID=861299 RepID=W0RE68_9BACT|nr:ABC transporter ATP-binding protein [Gemmatirosa kalamazoonensis]AHG88712.1 ABC transporter related protein [Gemmatirosa kalamazoonensis]
MTSATGRTALELRGVTKRFGTATALDGASLVVRAGTLHAVLGENGAGKTTLMRVAFGMLRPDAGEILVEGTPRRLTSPADAIAAGVGMVHQHFTIVPAMTVAENVALGGRGRYDAAAAAARVRAVAERTGLALDPAAVAGSLGVAAQQRLEIVKALARDARTLILDEPTAVLTPAESRELLGWLRTFVDDGHTVVLVTHRLRDALAFADDVTVLRRGRTAGALGTADATEARLAELVLGEPPPPPAPRGAAAPGAVVARAVGLRVVDARGVERVRGATLEVRAGEILGLAAVEGAGQHELLRALAGRTAASAGTLERPERAGFIPEDRHRDALLLDASLTENVALHGAGARRGLVPWRALGRRTADLLARFDVRAPGPRASARSLSGGNQQKLVVARELAADATPPPLLVAENPTRGLDVRATAAVHERLRAARDAGAAVVVHSTDLDEVLALADRVVAMYGGRVTDVPADREAVGRAMLGLDADPQLDRADRV